MKCDYDCELGPLTLWCPLCLWCAKMSSSASNVTKLWFMQGNVSIACNCLSLTRHRHNALIFCLCTMETSQLRTSTDAKHYIGWQVLSCVCSLALLLLCYPCVLCDPCPCRYPWVCYPLCLLWPRFVPPSVLVRAVAPACRLYRLEMECTYLVDRGKQTKYVSEIWIKEKRPVISLFFKIQETMADKVFLVYCKY